LTEQLTKIYLKYNYSYPEIHLILDNIDNIYKAKEYSNAKT